MVRQEPHRQRMEHASSGSRPRHAAHGALRRLGNGDVRHCVRQALKYTIGVKFMSALALAQTGRKHCFEQVQPSPTPEL
jgi:hypothetical protein